VPIAGLINVTGIDVYDNGLASRDGADVVLNNGDTVETFAGLRASIRNSAGWYLDFPSLIARNVGRVGQANTSILFTEYYPSRSTCDPLGRTKLNALHFETGTASPHVALTTGSETHHRGEGTISLSQVDFGVGMVRDVPESKTLENRIIVQDETGALLRQDINPPPAPKGRTSWREVPIDW
jgi:type IV pilus assembly protein PilY1